MKFDSELIYRSEKGSMAVEMIISFLAFIVFVGFMVNLINIYTFHNKMQYALNASAQDIASMSYVMYVKTGIKGVDKEVHKDSSKYMDNNDKTADQLFDTYEKFHKISFDLSTIKDFVQSAGSSYQLVKERTEDIDGTLIGILYRLMQNGMNKIKSDEGQSAAKILVPGYLETQDLGFKTVSSYEDVLKRYYVENVSYAGTEIFPDGTSLIKLQVQYDVNVGFFNINKPTGEKGLLSGIVGKDGSKIHIVQCAVVSGWNDGDGKKIGEK